MHALVAGAPFETVAPTVVIPKVIAGMGDRESGRSANAAPSARQTRVCNNVVADGRTSTAGRPARTIAAQRADLWRSLALRYAKEASHTGTASIVVPIYQSSSVLTL